MIVEGEFYKLKPIDDHSIRFDLELLYNISGKNPRKEFKNAGYGYSLDSAIKAIIAFAIHNKYSKEEVITLNKYLNEFREISEQIKKEITYYTE